MTAGSLKFCAVYEFRISPAPVFSMTSTIIPVIGVFAIVSLNKMRIIPSNQFPLFSFLFNKWNSVSNF